MLSTGGNSLHEWDLTPGREADTDLAAYTSGRGTYALSPDANWFLTSILNPGHRDGDFTHRVDQWPTDRSSLALVFAASFSPDGRLFALGWLGE